MNFHMNHQSKALCIVIFTVGEYDDPKVHQQGAAERN